MTRGSLWGYVEMVSVYTPLLNCLCIQSKILQSVDFQGEKMPSTLCQKNSLLDKGIIH